MQDKAERRTGQDRRSHPRYRIKQPAMLVSKTAGSASVQVLDIGRFGVRISAPFRLPVLDEVEIRLPDAKGSGIVRNWKCIRAIEFHVCIEILHYDPAGQTALDRSAVLRKAKSLNQGLGIDRRA